jgi:hypothetical protein
MFTFVFGVIVGVAATLMYVDPVILSEILHWAGDEVVTLNLPQADQ